MKLELTVFQSQGGRDYQEDSYLAFRGTTPQGEPWALIAVADGLGGHAHGDLASLTAINVLKDTVPDLQEIIDSGGSIEALDHVIDSAYRLGEQLMLKAGDAYDNRGTTLVVALVWDGKARFYNAGDSFGFVIGKNLKAATITVEHASEWFGITNCLAARRRGEFTKVVMVDHFQLDDLVGIEYLVVASDGIVDPDSAVGPTFNQDTDVEAATQIGELGMAVYGRKHKCDNTTVVALQVS